MLEKIGQLMFIGIEGPELKEKEKEFLITHDIGGVILFDRNIQNPRQVYDLTTSIQSLARKTKSQAPFFIGVDNEGGRVARLKEGFTKWPALAKVGTKDSTSLAFEFALAMGEELRAVGINLNFAPCVDVLTNPKNTVIGDRALHSDPEEVAKIASALVRGYIKSGVIPCAKHFPGHGNTLIDSHHDLPKEATDLETLKNRELVPFKKVFRARLDMVMTAHILFEKIDPEWPATLSEKFITGLLRGEMRYRGLIVTDDLGMNAMKDHFQPEDIPVRAIEAGCDLLLYCNEFHMPEVAFKSLSKAIKDGRLSAQRIDDSYQRVMNLKKSELTQLTALPWVEAQNLIKNQEHQDIAAKILA